MTASAFWASRDVVGQLADRLETGQEFSHAVTQLDDKSAKIGSAWLEIG